MDVLSIISTVVLLSIIVIYVIGIFVYDALRRRKGKVSIFLETCSCHHSGSAKRLLKAYRKQYGSKNGK